MLADSGEKEEVRAAVKMMSRFWVVENTVYGAMERANSGVVSARSPSRCASIQQLSITLPILVLTRSE